VGKVGGGGGGHRSTLMEAKKGVGIDGPKKRKGTKVHVLMNREGLPLSVAVGPGNERDRRRLEEVLGGFRVKKRGRGRARTRPRVVNGDAAYDEQRIREGLRRRGIRAGIPRNPRRGKGLFLPSEGLSEGSKQCGAVLQVAERRVPKAALRFPGLRPPRLLPHRLENFEMSSTLVK